MVLFLARARCPGKPRSTTLPGKKPAGPGRRDGVPFSAWRLASGPGLAYCSGVRSALLSLVLVLGLAVAAVAAEGPEQTVTPVVPGVEQRVEPVETGDVQRVEPLDPDQMQRISAESNGPVRRGLVTAGKVAVGIVALGVSLGFTVATLLLF